MLTSSFIFNLAFGPGGTSNEFPALRQCKTLYATLKPNDIPFTSSDDIQFKVPNSPPHIAAHLQGTQNPDTKPTLQKSCNCQRTANIALFDPSSKPCILPQKKLFFLYTAKYQIFQKRNHFQFILGFTKIGQ